MILLPDGSAAPSSEQVPIAKAFYVGGTENATTIEAIVGGAKSVSDRELYWQLYLRHPWIRSCVDLIADAVAGEGYVVQKNDGENAQSYDANTDGRVKSIHSFFRMAFPNSTLRRELLKCAIDNAVFGVCYWRKKRAGKLAIALERLDPRNVTRSKDLSTYILRKPNMPMDNNEKIPALDIVEIGNGIGDPLEGGLSPLEALDMTISTDMAIRKHRNKFFSNGATAGTVLVSKDANQRQIEAVERLFKSEKTGAHNAYKTTVIAGNWEVHSTAQSGKSDFDFVKASGISREEVFMVYKVPPGKLFINSGSLGSAGKSEDDATFQQNAVLPLEERIFEALTMQMMHTEWGIEDLEIVPKRRAMLRLDMFDAAALLVNFGGTGNEARALVNLQPLAVEGMDDPLFIGSRQPVADDDLAKANADKPNTVVKPDKKDAK